MIRCAVVGGSGYIGGEVLRALVGHPEVRVTAIAGNETAGKPIHEEQPFLRGFLRQDVCRIEQIDWDGVDVAFLCLGNGEAMKLVPRIPAHVHIIDLSADFRLKDPKEFEATYGPHACWSQVKGFAYGLPELFRAEIREARRVAAPGCFATASILALAPIAELVEGPVFVSAVTGSSGSGSRPRDKAHHPFRADSLFAYESFKHRHVPEIRQAIRQATGRSLALTFQPHSGPFVRGIFATVFATLRDETTKEKLLERYRARYPEGGFVRLVDGSPNVKWVRGTNFADIGVEADGGRAIVLVAIDNLVKGGAGQAVQCMNLMFRQPEEAGLRFPGMNP